MITKHDVECLEVANHLGEWLERFNSSASEGETVSVAVSFTEYTAAIEIDGIPVYCSESLTPADDVSLLDHCKAEYMQALNRFLKIRGFLI